MSTRREWLVASGTSTIILNYFEKDFKGEKKERGKKTRGPKPPRHKHK
jgi:hypothetical protein